jgi:hypothetical protein
MRWSRVDKVRILVRRERRARQIFHVLRGDFCLDAISTSRYKRGAEGRSRLSSGLTRL